MLIPALLLLITFTGAWAQEKMDNKRLEEVLRREVKKIEGEPGSWMLYHGDRILLVLTDDSHNRMRVFSPIVEEKKISTEELYKMLQANFHTALDAKYALYEGFVVSVFTHPLAELTEGQVADALQQVVRLADTFGSSYSSTELLFGGEGEQEQEKRINKSPSKGKKM
jgi:hypothetical protein